MEIWDGATVMTETLQLVRVRATASAALELPEPLEMPQARSGRMAAARVLAVEPDGRVTVAIGEAEMPAARALSCLVEPAAGDRVLLAQVDGESFVLAVLDRREPGPAPVSVSVPGAERVTLSAPHLGLVAGETLALSAAREVTIDSRTLSLRAHALSLVARLTTLVADHLRSTARRREIVADQIAVQAQGRTTLVRDLDVHEAGTLVQTVAGISSATAATAVMVAQEDLRFDGKRVTVG